MNWKYWIVTENGKFAFDRNPDKDLNSEFKVNIKDIANALSKLCRFNGHIDKFYSVGQHLLFITEQMKSDGYSPRLQMLGLIHDFHEGYITDISSPSKDCMRNHYLFDVSVYENAVDKQIFHDLEIIPPTDDEKKIVKYYDLLALFVEKDNLFQKYVDWEWGYDFEAITHKYTEDFMYFASMPMSVVKMELIQKYEELKELQGVS